MSSLLTRVAGGYAIPSGRVVRGRVQPPPSKSISQRALNLALLSARPMAIQGLLQAEDTELFLAAMGLLGYQCEVNNQRTTLHPGQKAESAALWCGNNGTMLRFLIASLSTIPGDWTLDGTGRLRQRPIGPLVDALRVLGADITYVNREGFAPVRIVGGLLEGGTVELDASLSSQFVSALLMAATRAKDEVIVHVRDLVSEPYLRITLEVLSSFGATGLKVSEPDVFKVQPVPLSANTFEVEGDFSSAAYPASAAVLTGGAVSLEGLGRNSPQGDRLFLEVLRQMGAEVEWRGAGCGIRSGGPLTAVDVDFSSLPDQVPTLAILAPFASGTTVIRNVRHLRIKESDRLAAMAAQLQRLGATIREREDGLEIEGSWADRSRIPSDTVEVKTYGDHRVAMSLAVCGLARPGVIVADPEVVDKSYPAFWEDLNHLIRG